MARRISIKGVNMHDKIEIPHPDSEIQRSEGQNRQVRRTAKIHIGESSLTWLFAHGRISIAQLQAGEKLRHDFTMAGLAPKMTMKWDDATAQSCTRRAAPLAYDDTPARIDAQRRFDAALAHVGPGLSDICWRVICAGEAIGDAERALTWPARSGRIILTLALDRLVHFYHTENVG
jgi:Domain of unknown function (DUF6456)